MLRSPQEANMPEASQTKQDRGGGISMSGGGGGEWERAGRSEAVLERHGTMAGLWAGADPVHITSWKHPVPSVLMLDCG